MAKQNTGGAGQSGGAVARDINNVYGAAETVLHRPEGANRLWMQVESGVFRIKPGAALGGTFTVNAGTNLATKAGHGFVTGDRIPYLTAATSLPSPLAANTNYYAIKNDDNSFYFADTQEDSFNNVAIDLADAGVGTLTITGVAGAPAGASVSNGQGSRRLKTDETVDIPAPTAITVKGGGATDSMSYYWY